MLVLATPNPSHRDYCAVLEVSSLNYALKTVGEQEAILAGYRAFLNGLTFPIQLLVQVRPLDLTSYAEQVRATPQRQVAANTHAPSNEWVGTRLDESAETGDASRVHDAADEQQAMWNRLAEDEAQYVLDLAEYKTLLERRFYLVLPADEQVALESSITNGSGALLSRSLLPGVGFLQFPGNGRRQRAARTRTEQRASHILDLRTQSVARELSRIGLEVRRLAGVELATVYYQSIAPDAARHHALSSEFLGGLGLPSLSRSPQHESHDEETPAILPTDTEESDIVNGSNHGDYRDISKDHKKQHAKQARRTGRRNWKASAIDSASATWGDLADVLAPAAIEVTRDDVRLDDTFCRTLAVVGYPRHVYHGWLERLIDLDEPLDVVLHLKPQSTAAMIRQLSHRLVQLHSSRLLNEERGRLGAADLGVAYEDVERTRERLQRGDERIFATSLYLQVRAPVASHGSPRQHLEERVARIEQELANQQLVARPATFEQDLGLLSCLPEGRDRLMRTRLLDTSSLATAFPFLSNSLSMPDGILFGTTANGSPVFIDIFSPLLENANQVMFAKSGAGKSYSCKIEALRSLVRGVDVYVVDPETEYASLAEAVGGQIVRLAAGAEHHLNPFDLPQSSEMPQARIARGNNALTSMQCNEPEARGIAADNQGESESGHGGDALADKVQSLHALLDLMLADRAPTGTVGLSQSEKGLLDRALYEVYRRAGISSDPATQQWRPAPLLRDLYDVLESSACGTDETHLADRLHRYVHGSLSRLFAKPTNVELSNHLVVFDVRDMDAELRPLGLFLIADFVWTRIRRAQRPRLLIIDEAWSLMQYQEGGRFLAGLARRARKYYLGLITITQDAEDFLSSEHGRTVLANSSVQMLMKQDSSTIEAVTRAFQLSTSERQFLLGCHKGEGLLFARGGHVALQVGASPLEHQLATTDPRELAERQGGHATFGPARPLAFRGTFRNPALGTRALSLVTPPGSTLSENRADRKPRRPGSALPSARQARKPVSRDSRTYLPPSAGDPDAFSQAHSEGADDLADEPPEDWTTGANGELSSALDEEEEF
ncbi:MAG TPA: hypothetical protein VH591_10500 [Ktedonobacterales bacterium]